MWEELFMNVSWLATAVLALVGIIKMPFKNFKTKHPKWYRATFFLLSLALIIGGSVIVELYILNESILSLTFAILVISTGCAVFGGYSAYESIGLKSLFHKLATSINNWKNKYSDNKIAKFIEKVGIYKIIEVNKTAEAKAAEEAKEVEQKAKIAEIDKTVAEVSDKDTAVKSGFEL